MYLWAPGIKLEKSKKNIINMISVKINYYIVLAFSIRRLSMSTI